MAEDRLTIGWRLDAEDREALLARLPPAYPRVVANHVTLNMDARPGERAPDVRLVAVVGMADDGKGVQALVVKLDGTTDRPDGSTYHITWSLLPGRRAVESNAVIAEHGWVDLPPIPIRLSPASF